MLGTLRKIWRAHLAGQRDIADELQQLRSIVAPLVSRLDAIERTLDEKGSIVTQEIRSLRQSIAALHRPVTEIESWAKVDFSLDVAGHIAALVAADGRHADPLSLPRYHAQVYSQNGEDGIIAEIFRRIGTRDHIFIEMGIETGLQNNTRFLLEQGWCGVWVEGSPECARAAAERYRDAVSEGRLKVISGYATPEGIDALLDGAEVPEEVDFLSLDIDQHTTHVWRALRRRARVSCIEYNASLPPSVALEVPYDVSKSWNGTNWFGGGLKAIELIGAAKGQHLVGCDVLGINAFLVAAGETAGKFRGPFTAEVHFQPPQYGKVTHTGHPPSEAASVWQEVRA